MIKEELEIKELVEWVARKLCSFDNRKWDSLYDKTRTLFDGSLSKEVYTRRARQILSHPNLALIAKEEYENKAWHKEDREYEAYCAGKNDVRATIVSLKEVLKDRGDRE